MKMTLSVCALYLHDSQHIVVANERQHPLLLCIFLFVMMRGC